jgi:hypothetical protein
MSLRYGKSSLCIPTGRRHWATGLNGRRVTVKRRGRNRGGEIAKQ